MEKRESNDFYSRGLHNSLLINGCLCLDWFISLCLDNKSHNPWNQTTQAQVPRVFRYWFMNSLRITFSVQMSWYELYELSQYFCRIHLNLTPQYISWISFSNKTFAFWIFQPHFTNWNKTHRKSEMEKAASVTSALVLFFPQAVLIYGVCTRKTCY